MSETIFDLTEDDLPDSKEGFLEFASRAPKVEDHSFFDTLADYGKTVLKGTGEGLLKLGLALGDSRFPFQPPVHPYTAQTMNESATELFDELLPTQEDYGQKSIRRGLRELPSVAVTSFGGPLETAVRTGLAGFAGQGAEELGLPEWAQIAAELTAYLGPDVTKKLLSQGKNKELIDAARSLGMSDEAITPLLQSETKQKWLSKLAPRRGFTQEALRKSKSGLSQASENLEKKASQFGALSENSSIQLFNQIDDKLSKMPSSVRNKILKDYADFKGSGDYTAEELINFYRDVNHSLGPKSKQLALLKEPLKNALKEISPELAKDFDLINTLYSKYYPISRRLQPNLFTDILSASEAIGTLAALTTGYYPPLLKVAGERTARKLAQHMLLNPRFQQISNKMINAVRDNNLVMAMKTKDLLMREVSKISPEIASKLSEVSEDELRELFTDQQKEEQEQHQ